MISRMVLIWEFPKIRGPTLDNSGALVKTPRNRTLNLQKQPYINEHGLMSVQVLGVMGVLTIDPSCMDGPRIFGTLVLLKRTLSLETEIRTTSSPKPPLNPEGLRDHDPKVHVPSSPLIIYTDCRCNGPNIETRRPLCGAVQPPKYQLLECCLWGNDVGIGPPVWVESPKTKVVTQFRKVAEPECQYSDMSALSGRSW